MNESRRTRPWRALSILALLCSTLLSGCSFMLATENSDPYTADDVIAMVEEGEDAEGSPWASAPRFILL